MTHDENDIRATVRLWLERHDYPADPEWQVRNLLIDIAEAGFSW